MSIARTLTATVAALYLGMGSAGAEEPKTYEKKRQLRCSTEWNDLLSNIPTNSASDEPSHKQLELQLDKSSYITVRTGKYGEYMSAVMSVVGMNKSETLFRIYYNGLLDDSYMLVDVYVIKYDGRSMFPVNNEDLDLSNPTIRQAAEKKFCGYVKQVAAKYHSRKDHQPSKRKVQEQLDLLK